MTLGHTAPLILFSFKNGPKAVFFTGLTYGIFQILISFHVPPVKNFITFVFVILLDYLVPYAMIGLAPFYVKVIKNKKNSVVIGTLFTGVFRLLSSTLSGVVIWNEYVAKNINLWIYSLFYNSSYMIPEIIITAVLCYTYVNFLLPSKLL